MGQRLARPLRGRLSRDSGSTKTGAARSGVCGFLGQREIDLRLLEVDARDLDPQAPGQLEREAAPLADERVPACIEMEIVAAELGDVDEAVDVEAIERHEQAEARDAADRAVEILAYLVLHEVALEPVGDVARGLVGAALGHRRVDAQLLPGHSGGLVLLARERGLDGAVDEQVRVAPDRRREVRIRFVRQAEMPLVVRPVLRLRQRTQQHRLQQLEVRALAHAVEQLGVIGGRRLRAAAPDAARRSREIRAMPRACPAAGARARDTGPDAGARPGNPRCRRWPRACFLDQLVRVVARIGNDARDLAVLVEFDRELDRVEVDRAALFAGGGERLVQRIQVVEMRQQRLRFGALWRLRRRKPRPHLGVGEARVRMHDGRVEPVRANRALRRDFHVAGHAQPIDVAFQ